MVPDKGPEPVLVKLNQPLIDFGFECQHSKAERGGTHVSLFVAEHPLVCECVGNHLGKIDVAPQK